MADLAAFAWAGVFLGFEPLALLVFGVLGALATRPAGVRRARIRVALWEDVGWLSARVALAGLAAALLPLPSLGADRVVVAAPVALALLLLLHGLGLALAHALRVRGVGLDPTIILGAGPTGVSVARVLDGRREFGLAPVGFLDVFPPEDAPAPQIGHPEDLPGIMLRYDIRRVIVAFGGRSEGELVRVLRDCDQLPFDFHLHVLPRFFELGIAGEGSTDDLWGFPLVPVRRSGHRRWGWRLKRAFDVAFAATTLVLTAPLYGLITLLVRASSPGPVLFRQKRVGQYGQPFEMLKFRSMRENDDGDTRWTADEDRITGIGRILRPTHLDELPQLLNVLRGDMSVVGPRPERPAFVDRFAAEFERYEDRHRVPVGITGWAQVNGLWGDTSIRDRARFDNRYIEDWSLWRDLLIVIKTLPTLFGRRDDEETESPDDANEEVRSDA